MIKELAKAIHANAKQKGFYEEPKNIAEILCLIHSEVSEALEALRKNKFIDKKNKVDSDFLLKELNINDWNEHFNHHIKDTFEDEMADVIIRVLDLCEYMKIDIEWHINAKMRNNELRPYKHNKRF